MRRRSWPVALVLLALTARAGADQSLGTGLVAAAPSANPKVLALAARAARSGSAGAQPGVGVVASKKPAASTRWRACWLGGIVGRGSPARQQEIPA